jgi:ribonuclease Z
VVGISDLWLTGWIEDGASRFECGGPEGTKEMMSHIEQAYQLDIHMRRDVDEKWPSQGGSRGR